MNLARRFQALFPSLVAASFVLAACSSDDDGGSGAAGGSAGQAAAGAAGKVNAGGASASKGGSGGGSSKGGSGGGTSKGGSSSDGGTGGTSSDGGTGGTSGDAGTGGTNATAGTGGKSGNAGIGGKGGAAGKGGGAAGTGGSGTAGTTGSAGTTGGAGTTGSAGTTGGAGTTGSAGSGNAAGTGGSGPTCGDTTQPQGGEGMKTSLSQAQKDEILAAHNAFRATKCLPPLTWSDSAADVAQTWAEGCKGTKLLDHNPGRGNLGENIYASGGPSSAQSAVALWFSEQKNYTDGVGCQAGKVCGHYTQVMWKSTTAVGCGVSVCDNLQFKYTLVCNYAPPGNFGGQLPYWSDVAQRRV